MSLSLPINKWDVPCIVFMLLVSVSFEYSCFKDKRNSIIVDVEIWQKGP